MKYLPRVLRYMRPYWRQALFSVLATVILSLAALLGPWPLKILFDSVLSSMPLPAVLQPLLGPFEGDPWVLALVVVSAGFGLTLFGNGLQVVNSYVETRLTQGMVLNFRSDLFQHAQRLSLAYHQRMRAGTLIYAINFQANSAAGLVTAVLPLAQSALTLVGMFLITHALSPRLALLSLTVVPFLYLAVGHYVKRIQPRLREVRNMEGESLSIIHEAISMLRVILAFGREDHEHDRFRAQGQEAVDARVGVTVRQTAFSLAVNTATAAGTALVLGFGVDEILQGRLSAGELLVVLSYVASIYKPLETITNTVGSLQERFIALEMAFELLDRVPRIRNHPDPVRIGRARGEIVFEDVSFAHDGRPHTLQQVAFRASPGELVGIVGPTGAGKSTLVSLLPRFHDANQGRVLLDGLDIKRIHLKDLRAQISIVLQESLLFSGTIAENIRYGALGATMEQVEAAARAANAHDFITALPDGYDSRLGEKGVGLSGGERQRIAVARAFLKDAPILILDEPTSSIDSRTEGVILDALERLVRGRTTIMIAHRLSTVAHADQILVMDEGRIVEQGTPDALLARNGLYARLWEAQTGGRSPKYQDEGAYGVIGAGGMVEAVAVGRAARREES
ncbi:MAG TPA: ABC transporter ATP-binding protein [Longimicrobiales bacterium]|nr:ABC transporter ATP-binding protein [Longimicrobiales bacterium]